MAQMSLYLFTGGLLSLVFAFVFHVAHTAMLASGGRSIAALVPAGRLAGAGAGGGAGSVDLGPAETPRAGLAGATIGGARVDAGADEPAPGTPVAGIALTGAAVAWALIGLSMLLRAIVVGRGPWGNMYEFAVAFSWGILTGYLFLQRRYPIRSLGFVPVGVALFLAGYAATLPSTIEPLVPALDNAPLLTVHVAMAMISYGIFATSFAAAVGYLLQGSTDRYAWLPSHRVLDAVAYRAVIIGFPIFATMIVLGSWWASIAWGRYWGWDPKETSALVTWLIYAVYLHARNQRGWAGRPAALILVIGFGAILFTFFGNLYFSGLHAYSGLN
jgi:cytochrome c-type biogenesis protein CcsB